jgi:hypothetical protein
MAIIIQVVRDTELMFPVVFSFFEAARERQLLSPGTDTTGRG